MSIHGLPPPKPHLRSKDLPAPALSNWEGKKVSFPASALEKLKDVANRALFQINAFARDVTRSRRFSQMQVLVGQFSTKAGIVVGAAVQAVRAALVNLKETGLSASKGLQQRFQQTSIKGKFKEATQAAKKSDDLKEIIAKQEKWDLQNLYENPQLFNAMKDWDSYNREFYTFTESINELAEIEDPEQFMQKLTEIKHRFIEDETVGSFEGGSSELVNISAEDKDKFTGLTENPPKNREEMKAASDVLKGFLTTSLDQQRMFQDRVNAFKSSR